MKVSFVGQDGQVSIVDAQGQPTLMRLAVENGIAGIVAECNGALACATCHVIVDDAWIDRLPSPRADENEMLDCLETRLPGSRLACQLRLAPALDDVLMRLAGSDSAASPAD